MDRQDRVVRTKLPAAVYDLLCATLNLGVTALHRVKIQVFGVGAGVHTRGGATAHADQHARTAQLHQQGSSRQPELLHMLGGNIAYAAGDHDGLVIAAHHAIHLGFKAAEVTGEIGASELIIE